MKLAYWQLSRRACFALLAHVLPGRQCLEKPGLTVEHRPRSGWNLPARFTTHQLDLLCKLNRADHAHLPSIKVLVTPDNWDLREECYGPFVLFDPRLEQEVKILIVDIPLQAFAAYEYGVLVRWGPVSSGSAAHPTPAGVFHLNWKSKGRYSTVDPIWYLPYSFNFENRAGLSLHAYALPGYPASHSCVRLLMSDARWLYGWGEEWVPAPDGRSVDRRGTKLWIMGRYLFGTPPPWIPPSAALQTRNISAPDQSSRE